MQGFKEGRREGKQLRKRGRKDLRKEGWKVYRGKSFLPKGIKMKFGLLFNDVCFG